MSELLEKITRLFDDAPPEFVFEIGSAGIAWGRKEKGRSTFLTGQQKMDADVLAISPAQDNLTRPEAFAQAVNELAPQVSRKRRGAVLILPDYCGRITVLDFDTFPGKTEEQLALIKFRLKKGVPFDVDQASISYFMQPKTEGKKSEVVVAVVAQEILARYEAPFRAAGFWPGMITTSTLAAADLIPAEGTTVLLKHAAGVLTAAVFRNKTLKMVRTVELMQLTVEEVAGVLFPTLAYMEDEWKLKADRIVVCGFGKEQQDVEAYLRGETGLLVEPLRSPHGAASEENAGLLGYLTSKGAA